ncbi:nucleophile aminohydrolase [Suillus lakei]|nr:nucleophile aminohydrolase [Suillus lakei]
MLKPGKKSAQPNYVLVIHGGAGTMIREGSTPEQRAMYRAALSRALKAGYEVLKSGGEAMDAAVAAVSVMEGGINNLLQSHPAMPSSRRGSSVTLITHTRNPSHLARALYLAPQLAPHPMLSGAAAEATGASLGVRQADPSYFWTEARWREHRRGLGLPEDPVEYPRPEIPDDTNSETTDVASFSDDKLVGRVGDTPVMGCGFWAEEWERDGGFVKRSWDRLRGKSKYEGVGVSGTGDGDYYIRRAAASNIARRMQYLGESLDEATQNVIDDLFKEGGMGGVIALDRDGNVALPLNCSGMYRGVIRPDGVPLTAIFFDEQLTEL